MLKQQPDTDLLAMFILTRALAHAENSRVCQGDMEVVPTRGPYESPMAAGGLEQPGPTRGADLDPTKHHLIAGEAMALLLTSRK